MAIGVDWIGRELSDGRYRVNKDLGGGGMALVYAAWDKTLDCAVVIKTPRAALLEDPTFGERFTREIRALVALSHPHVVKVIDVGRCENMPFAVMQFLGGGDLKDRLTRDAAGRPQPQRTADVLDWLPKIAAALDFIHGRGFVHRDVKPANILYDEHGNAYLSDFGVAKAIRDADDKTQNSSLTGTGLVMGTPDYLAPEVILGEPFDGRADQYALAVAAYELLAGRVPFVGPTPSAVLVHHTTQAPAPLSKLCSGLPAGLSEVVARGLAKRPADRFPSCMEFARAFEQACRQGPAVYTAQPVPETPTTAPVRRATAVATPVAAKPMAQAVKQRDTQTARTAVTARQPQPTAPSAVPTTAPIVVPQLRRRLIWGGAAALLLLSVSIAAFFALRSNDPSKLSTEYARGLLAPPDPELADLNIAVDGAKVDFDQELLTTVKITGNGPKVSPRYSFGQGAPQGLTIDDAGKIRWPATTYRPHGTYQVEVCAMVIGPEAGKNFRVRWRKTCHVSFTVTPPPIFSQLAAEPATPVAGQPLKLKVAASRADGSPQRTFQYRLDKSNTWRDFTGNEATIAETPTKPFVLEVRSTGNNGLSSPSQQLALTPSAPPPPPSRDPVAPKAGDSLENSIGMKLQYVAPGEFIMGSPTSESGRANDERQHAVRITRGFFVGKFEVTQGEYEAVVGRNPAAFTAGGSQEGRVRGSTRDFPVESVSWSDATEFCRRLSQLTEEKEYGRRYRLPTEAEWEFFARAGTVTAFHTGTAVDDKQLPFARYGEALPVVVGRFPPNAWGLHDVHGNVWEWCADHFSASYYDESPDPAVDPQGPSSGKRRVLRGGGWDSNPAACRSAYRDSRDAGESAGNLGFRVVMTVVPTETN